MAVMKRRKVTLFDICCFVFVPLDLFASMCCFQSAVTLTWENGVEQVIKVLEIVAVQVSSRPSKHGTFGLFVQLLPPSNSSIRNEM